MPRVHFTKKARKNYPQYGVKKGDSYYYWTFYGGRKVVSKTAPKPWQLTQSAFKQSVLQLIDQASSANFLDSDGVSSYIDTLKGELEQLRTESEESLENMPEQLRDSSFGGSLLTERVDTLEDAISDLDGIDTETTIDPNEDNVHAIEEFDEWAENVRSEIDNALGSVSL